VFKDYTVEFMFVYSLCLDLCWWHILLRYNWHNQSGLGGTLYSGLSGTLCSGIGGTTCSGIGGTTCSGTGGTITPESVAHFETVYPANPLDFSKGMPPTMIPSLSNTNSLGEEIQKTFPEARVVKALNTMWCGLMVDPNMIGGGDHAAFISGNDADARAIVRSLMNRFGWKNENIIDLGDITAARGTEALLPLWLRIWGATQKGVFNFKIVS
jgi:hypothetical protein